MVGYEVRSGEPILQVDYGRFFRCLTLLESAVLRLLASFVRSMMLLTTFRGAFKIPLIDEKCYVNLR